MKKTLQFQAIALAMLSCWGCGDEALPPEDPCTEATCGAPDSYLDALPGLVETASAQTASTTRCADPEASNGLGGTWSARYDVVLNPVYGPLVRVRELLFESVSRRGTKEFWLDSGEEQQWTLLFQGWQADSPQPSVRDGNQRLYDTAVSALFNPRIVTPNGRCVLYLDAFSLASTIPETRVALVGDSISHAYNKTLEARMNMAEYLAGRGWGYLADAWPGQHLHTYREPGGGNSGRAEIRGLVGTNPAALIIALGTNDAIIGSAEILNETGKHAQFRQNFEADVRGALDDALRQDPERCILLVTPGDRPTPHFGLQELYADEARYVGQYYRDLANRDPMDNLHLVDWATISRDHHLPDGEPDDWFSDSDPIHPEGAASLHFVSSWSSALSEHCP